MADRNDSCWFRGISDNDIIDEAKRHRDLFETNALRLERKTTAKHSNTDFREIAQVYSEVRTCYERACRDFVSKVEEVDREQGLIMFSRWRAKSPCSLMRKLQTRAIGDGIAPDDIADVFLDNNNPVTDLGGVRLLHLTRKDGNRLVKTVTKAVGLIENWGVRERIAYVPNIDDYRYLEDGEHDFEGLSELQPAWQIKKKSSGYTSYHYVIRCDGTHLRKALGAALEELETRRRSEAGHAQRTKREMRREDILKGSAALFIEVQTRSLIEEGWSEIEHRRRYKGRSGHLVDHGLNVLKNVASLFDDVASNFDEIDKTPATIPLEKVAELCLQAAVVTILSPDLTWMRDNVTEFASYIADGHAVYHIFARGNDEGNAKSILEKLDGVLRPTEAKDVRGRVLFWKIDDDYIPSGGSDHWLLSTMEKDEEGRLYLQATRRLIGVKGGENRGEGNSDNGNGTEQFEWEEIRKDGSLDGFVGALERQVESFLAKPVALIGESGTTAASGSQPRGESGNGN